MVRYLAEQGHQVLAVDRKPPHDATRKAAWDKAHDHQVICLETTKPDLTGMDVVYHFAADMGGVGYFHTHDFWPYIVNSRIDLNVLQAMTEAEVGRGFVAASACIYPTEIQMEPGNAPRLREEQAETGQPDQMYGRGKLMLLRLAERAPVDVRVGILHTVYGVGQESHGERMKFPTAIATKAIHARETGRLEVWGDGQQLRSFLWIDDAVAKIAALTMDDRNIGPTNIGYQGAVSVAEIAALCCELVGADPVITYTTDKPTGVVSRDCDNAKFWEHYGNMEPTDYREGFTRLIEWLES
jgi:nucleoside-diphosphate-sugar epimerase